MTVIETHLDAPAAERRAVKATDPAKFPHPLPAKKVGKAYRIKADDLAAWVDALPDG